MNFVAHLLVALDANQGGPTSDFAFGSVLPDLASMGRLRFDRSNLTAETLTGVKLHNATDEAFHSHKWFTAQLVDGVGALTSSGVPRGAARACAHLGVELLLDGVLLEDQTTSDATGKLFASLGGQRAAGPDNDDWPRLLTRAAEYGPPSWYNQPTEIAGFLQRLTSYRSRLAFDAEQQVPVEEWLTEIRPAVAAGAWGIVEDIALSVGGS